MGRPVPDFLIAGSPRCSTGWFFQVLDAHPRFFLAQPEAPEPKFFLVDELFNRGLDYYRQTWFADVPPDCVSGEKSTNYLESSVCAERVGQVLPEVKIVLLLRDPVERAISNYFWSVKHGRETLPITEAFSSEAERERNLAPEDRYARPHAYVSRGCYADLIKIWAGHLSLAQIHVIITERMLADPVPVFSDLCYFLGVPDLDLITGAPVTPVNTAPRAQEVPAGLRAQLQQRFAPENRKLETLLGQALPEWSS